VRRAKTKRPAAPCMCRPGVKCALHGPIFRELEDPEGVPARAPPIVHQTPQELPFFRKRPRARGKAALQAELERLQGQVQDLVRQVQRTG